MGVEPRLSATVLLLRNSLSRAQGVEVFMVRRVIQSEFMPDVYVFPGGSVSADDKLAEETPGVCAPVTPALVVDPEERTVLGRGVRAAAIRELFEEGNVLLAYQNETLLSLDEESSPRFTAYRQSFNERKGSLLDLAQRERLVYATDRLYYFSHWITPEGMPKRFDTHFFLAATPEGQEAEYDRLETSEGVWLHPIEALQGFERGEIPLVFATYYQLRDLAAFSTVQDALQTTTIQYVPINRPVREQRADGIYVYLPGEEAGAWKL